MLPSEELIQGLRRAAILRQAFKLRAPALNTDLRTRVRKGLFSLDPTEVGIRGSPGGVSVRRAFVLRGSRRSALSICIAHILHKLAAEAAEQELIQGLRRAAILSSIQAARC